MTPEISSRALVLLSMVYGGTIAILAVTDSGAVGIVAIVGAIVLGLLWAAHAMFMRKPG